MPSTGERAILAIELGPLREAYHTGIANVAKKLASEMLGDDTIEPRFFIGRQAIPTALVEKLVEVEGGVALGWFAGRSSFVSDQPTDVRRGVTGIYTHHKPQRRFFSREVLVLHDLTTLVTPGFHTDESVTFENARRLADVASSDLVVAVSESTYLDLRTYHPEVSHIPCIVAPLASCASEPAVPLRRSEVEPYVLVLGTLEPRKNVEFVLEFLSLNEELLDTAAFVFVGRWGWGSSVEDLLETYGLEKRRAEGSIRFPGYLSDNSRDMLIAHARCVVYPSRYEGFGLPVLEALQLGVPVITGHGSSLPEAGGDAAIYCDLAGDDSFPRALMACLAGAESDRIERGRQWAGRFSWKRTYQTIRDAALIER